jgi:hypothetical protein
MPTSSVRPDLVKEVESIISSAQAGVTRVVGLGPLVLFATDTGDAWLLDWEDQAALCLARAGEPQDADITDGDSSFAIEWASRYSIDGKTMIFQHRSGGLASVQGYPIAAIMETVRRLQRGA